MPGTTISGIVADPGPDGQPGTRDDVRAGADGILGTADDIYLNPIAGATVYILGLENEAVTSARQRLVHVDEHSCRRREARESTAPPRRALRRVSIIPRWCSI